MKAIIALWNKENKGKSDVLRRLANILLKKHNEEKIQYSYPEEKPTQIAEGDFTLILKINDKIIGIASAGDPGSDLQNRLTNLIGKHHCDVIICATRTRGETTDGVNIVAHEKGFQVIWTSTYDTADSTQQHVLNGLKAKHILEMLETLGFLEEEKEGCEKPSVVA